MNYKKFQLFSHFPQSILFVNVRTDEDNLSETISTLSFGDAARNVSSDTVKRRKKKRPQVSAAAAETARASRARTTALLPPPPARGAGRPRAGQVPSARAPPTG